MNADTLKEERVTRARDAHMHTPPCTTEKAQEKEDTAEAERTATAQRNQRSRSRGRSRSREDNNPRKIIITTDKDGRRITRK